MRSALKNVAEIKDLKTNPSPTGGTATFQVPKDFDYAAKLDEFAEGGNGHIAGWKKVN